MGNKSSKPDLSLNQELETPWRRFDCRQKEVLKKRLEKFSVSNPDVKDIKILVAGQTGAGKSSFINSVNNIFQGRITSSAIVESSSGTSSKSFTTKLTTHRVRSVDGELPFTLSDIMGLEPEEMCGSQPEDIIKAIYGHVKNDYKFNPGEPLSHESEDYISDPLLSDQAFCLVYILDANSDFDLNKGLTDKLHIIRKRCSENRIPQVIVMTKVDLICPLVSEDLQKIYTSKKIKEKMEICSHKIGVPMNHIFPVKNYSDEIDVDDDVDVLILMAFDQIVNLANDRLRDAASNCMHTGNAVNTIPLLYNSAKKAWNVH